MTTINVETPGVSPANPTATAGPTAVNGSLSTYMRSDAAPAVQKASSSQFGIVEVDNTTITSTAGVITAIASIASWVPVTDGAEPPTLISDGAGQLVFVAWSP